MYLIYPYIHVYIELNVHNVNKNKPKRNTEIRLVTPVNRWYDNNTTDKKHE